MWCTIGQQVPCQKKKQGDACKLGSRQGTCEEKRFSEEEDEDSSRTYCNIWPIPLPESSTTSEPTDQDDDEDETLPPSTTGPEPDDDDDKDDNDVTFPTFPQGQNISILLVCGRIHQAFNKKKIK